MKVRSQEYRALAAECLRLAATTDDANSHAQYTALAQMWTSLADEANQRAILTRAQDAFNETQMVQQQEQAQPKKPKRDEA
jgi:hypothetical protein